MSRREKFDETKKEEYLELLRNGGRRHASARAVGIDPTTVQEHMRKYPEFAVEVSKAEMEANEAVEDALFQAASSGNVTAIQVWLYNRMPEAWADKRNIKVGGVNSDSVKVEFDVDSVQSKIEEVLRQRNGSTTEHAD